MNRLYDVTLNIEAGTVRLASSSAIASALTALATSGNLDITNNKLVLKSGTIGAWNGTNYTGVLGLVKSGRNNGTWTGPGIITSQTDAASPNTLTTVAVARAADVGYSAGGTNGPDFFQGPATSPNAHLVALLVTGVPGSATDLLVVVPEPRTTQVLYDDNGTGSFRPVSGTTSTDGVVLIDRAASSSAATDRLQLLTGNGDPATDVLEQGPVSTYLCGVKGCG